MMDLAFSPSQQLLQQSARALLQQRCPPERVQELALDPRGFAADLWKEIATLGWPGLLVPPDLGGGGGGVSDVLALVEELGRACFPGPYIGSAVVATSALAAAGGRRARALLPALALGMELLGPYATLRAGSPWARFRGEIEHQYQTSWGHTIAGGTSEIQRTTIAVRALGLPAEPRARA